jgi:hypothetical protein
MSKTQGLILELVIRTIIVLSFLTVSGIVIASANGYLFNPDSLSFEQTGIINIDVKPSLVEVSVNSKKNTYVKDNINLVNLVPGTYSLEITKVGYMPWSKTLELAAGEAAIFPWVTLFVIDEKRVPATLEQVTRFESQTVSDVEYPDLDVRGSELWVKPVIRTYPVTVTRDAHELIGRFSVPIEKALWFTGRSRLRTHIIFQINNEIHVIDRDGSNDHLLVRLEASGKANFIISDDSKTLLYKDGDTVYQRALQE